MTSRYNPESIRAQIVGTGESLKIFVDHNGNRGTFIPVPGSNDLLYHFMPMPHDLYGTLCSTRGMNHWSYALPIRSNVSAVSILSGEVYRQVARLFRHGEESLGKKVA